MGPYALKQLSASGEVGTAGSPRVVFAIVLTAAAAAATATFLVGGSGGTALLTLACPANDSRVVLLDDGVSFGSGCYVTITGAGAFVSVAFT